MRFNVTFGQSRSAFHSGHTGGRKNATTFGIIGFGLLFIVILMVMAGRATGMIDFVGYEWKSKSSSGMFSTKAEPISLVSPVWLETGDQLIARYDANIRAGEIWLFMRRGLIPQPFMREFAGSEYVRKSGTGEVVLTANEPGLYWPASRLTSGNMSKECRARYKSKSLIENMVVPDSKCPTRSASYSISWSWRAGEQPSAR